MADDQRCTTTGGLVFDAYLDAETIADIYRTPPELDDYFERVRSVLDEHGYEDVDIRATEEE